MRYINPRFTYLTLLTYLLFLTVPSYDFIGLLVEIPSFDRGVPNFDALVQANP